MCYHQDGCAERAVHIGKCFEQHPGGFGIQGAGGFIGKNDFRVVNQRPCTGTALFLPAGYLVGELVTDGPDIQPFHDILCPFFDLPFPFFGQRHGKSYVFFQCERV